MLLRRNLTDYFSDDELRALCSEIGVDYERLRGQGKAAKASEIVRYLAARARIPELVTHAIRLRPNVSWGDIPRSLAGTASSIERSGPSGGIGPALGWSGWFVVTLIVVAGLVFFLSGGLRRGGPKDAPSPAPDTPSPAPTASTLAAATPTPAAAAVTATRSWTPTPTVATPTRLLMTETPTLVPTPTPTLAIVTGSNLPRTVTLLAPLNGACSTSPVVTFKWTGAILRPGESFLVALVPSEVNKGQCSSNYARGIQSSPPLMGYEWTTDISAPPETPAACAGPVEWTVYVKSVTGTVAPAAPAQYFEWNPLKCVK